MNSILNSSAVQCVTKVRLFHTSLSLCCIGKVMNKVLNKTKSERRKFKFYEASMPSKPSDFNKSLFETKSRNSRRVNILNKLFMRYITDLMSTGECSSYFVGRGIEISRVAVSPDFSCVSIFWIARGTENDNIIEKILKTHVGALRHELAQLKVVGVIPTLQFVKDKEYACSAEIERLLAIADFGDDYIPVNLTTKLTTQLELQTTLEPHIVKKIQDLDKMEESEENVYEEPIPPMPQNIFNLNHSAIMEQIIKSKKISQAPHRLAVEDETHNTATCLNKNPFIFSNTQQERAVFKDFLQKRQILKKRSSKEDKNYQPDLEYLREEWLEQQKHKLEHFDDILDEEDYIDEDLHEK